MSMIKARSETAIEPPRVRTLDMKPERRCSDKQNNAFKARNPTMTKFMLVLTIASLSIVNAGFAWAQAAVQEPGAYAFYHPDGDVLHARSGQYGAGAEAYGSIGIRHAMASAGRPARGHRHVRTQ